MLSAFSYTEFVAPIVCSFAHRAHHSETERLQKCDRVFDKKKKRTKAANESGMRHLHSHSRSSLVPDLTPFQGGSLDGTSPGVETPG